MKPGTQNPERPEDVLAYESRFWSTGRSVAGVDEAGRGPLAGPVIAAAVVLAEGVHVEGAGDSKKLSFTVREELYAEILAEASSVGIGVGSVQEIDRYNILNATTLAMNRAVTQLSEHPGHIVVDGLPVKKLKWEHDAVVGGDGLVHSIACASIVAKVTRDRLMRRLALRYPGYSWEKNVGYGTVAHHAAIKKLGLTSHHRVTFGGLQYELDV
ncbi:MAG: ribonuclease HII [Gemmatimonadetes bacterium]|nr:ribonuclease HII [Gemmatimonadota bacterium]